MNRPRGTCWPPVHSRRVALLLSARHKPEGDGVNMPWLRGLGLVGAVLVAATTLAKTAAAAPPPALPSPPPAPGMGVDHESGRCTAGFAAQGADGSYYLMTSG